ncbi:MAG: glycoside hydrolase [Pirellulales bacterium]|nr:glycoside hydrolase [Pirellulales bacterium]
MARNRMALMVSLASIVAVAAAAHAQQAGVERVQPARFYPLLMPDGKLWGTSVQALSEGHLALCAVESADSGHTWGPRRVLVELPEIATPATNWGDAVPLVERSGQLHAFLLRWDASDKQAPFPKLALWHLQAAPPYDKWTEPRLLFDGYIGALLSAVQLKSGTIVAPFAYMTTRHYSQSLPGLMSYVYMGEHTTTAVFSRDGGATFATSPTPINLPASIILGNENGAIEPVCLELRDGRVWMLIRTQLGRLWESFSSDGASWSPPRPSQFFSSDSPAGLTRLADGRIVLLWNNCQRYPYAHGGRQVLHAAISSDEGQSWSGFREVLRDPKRLEPAHPIRGDYGSAYPIGAATPDGKLLFATGQGATAGVYKLDPEWLLAREATDDFTSGLEAWSAYGTKGVELVDHPTRPGARVLRIVRSDAEFPAGAVWNFPNGRQGTVKIRFAFVPGQGATTVTLTDHFSSPFDRQAELNGLFSLALSADTMPRRDADAAGGSSSVGWHELVLAWDFATRRCVVSLDGRVWRELPQLRLGSHGVNYLRFRAASDTPIAGGVLVESVAAKVDPTAPPSDAPDSAPTSEASVLKELETGVLYRNPAPHLKSVHAYFPSVVNLADGNLLASGMVAEAFEAVGARVHLFRSTDQGTTWRHEGPLAHDLDGQLVSESGRLTQLADGRIVALLHRHDRREHPDEGLVNPQTLGFVPTTFAISESTDEGRTWSAPREIKPPLAGPSFELCSPITVLGDGRWLLPTSTWRDWSGRAPSGNRMVALVSRDAGRNWPTYLDVMHHPSDKVLYWESKIVELADGTLVAVAWGYDEATGRDLPNQYAISRDGGQSWSAAASTGLLGQTLAPIVLAGDRILCVYRRIDVPGLWAQVAHLEQDRWVNDQAQPLWGHNQGGLTGSSSSMAQNFQVLRFGAPCITRLPDGRLFVAFWCYEDTVGLLRWFRFRLD